MPVVPPALSRSFSAPYPPLDSTALEPWDHVWPQQPAEDLQVYQQAVGVEGYIVGLLQRYTLASRPCQPRTTLGPDTPHAASGHSSTPRKAPGSLSENLLLDPALQADLSTNPANQKWGCDLLEEEAPSLEGDSYLALPYPQSRSQSLSESLPSPLPPTHPNSGPEAFEPPSPQNCIHPQLQTINHTLVSAGFLSGPAWRAPAPSPRPFNPPGSRSTQTAACDDRPHSKPRSTKKNHNERQRAKKSGSKSSRSQSENSLPGQPGLPERGYSSAERQQGSQVHLELSQDEGESMAAHMHRRQQRRARSGHPPPHCYQRLRPDGQQRAPLCQEEDGYAATAPAESESSTSEVYSPASSSLSSDSDESGGLVWPQQLPPCFPSTSSCSPSPQTAANATSQPKAFVKIKASHALKRKILRFRSGSLKVMTTV